jgi:uncharacterized RDD family membrane protein YckC
MFNEEKKIICHKCKTPNLQGAFFCSNCSEQLQVLPAQPRYAGFFRRVVASCIDALLAIILSLPLTMGIIIFTGNVPSREEREQMRRTEQILREQVFSGAPAPSDPDAVIPADMRAKMLAFYMALGLVNLFIEYAHSAIMDSSRFQGTVGKLLVGIKVTKLNGDRISFKRANLRSLARLLSRASFYIGYLIAAFTARKQTLHDLLSKCVVVRK